MNKQELIKRIEALPYKEGPIADTITINRNWMLESIEQLDEPQKVTIPQFVADWIKRSKQEKRNLRNALNNGGEKMRLWFLDQENYDLFARAWLDGYEVEKEKQYRIKLKSNSKEIDYLVNTERNGLRFYSMIYTQRREHTRKELEDAGFGWVFDCPGIEVEEVE